LKKLIINSEFTKNTTTLVVGTVIAQSIPLILQIYLRRIYSVEDFGALTVFLSLFGMITLGSCLRYESTIVLPKNDIEAANIVSLTFLISLSINFIIFVAIFLFKDSIIEIIGLPHKFSIQFLSESKLLVNSTKSVQSIFHQQGNSPTC